MHCTLAAAVGYKLQGWEYGYGGLHEHGARLEELSIYNRMAFSAVKNCLAGQKYTGVCVAITVTVIPLLKYCKCQTPHAEVKKFT